MRRLPPEKTVAVTNFTITGLTVVNTLNKGTVAPYNAAVLNYVEYMKPGGEKECKNYFQLLVRVSIAICRKGLH